MANERIGIEYTHRDDQAHSEMVDHQIEFIVISNFKKEIQAKNTTYDENKTEYIKIIVEENICDLNHEFQKIFNVKTNNTIKNEINFAMNIDKNVTNMEEKTYVKEKRKQEYYTDMEKYSETGTNTNNKDVSNL